MKKIIALTLCALSLNVFAGPVEDAVNEVEVERNAECTLQSRSTFSKCFGMPQTCFYTVKFKCLSNEGAFGLKVKVQENFQGTKVRQVIITK
jgi:hypothetical protein